MTTKLSSIGVFDSGFGGLTVMRALKKVLPQENICYFGDTARLPYGNKSPETILRYTQESSAFLIDQGIKLLVIACNSACTAALSTLETTIQIPLFGVIAPGVEEAIRSTSNGRIAILGTRATISSNTYQEAIQNRLPNAEIFALSCPLFVPLVEEGYIEHALTEMTIREYLRPLQQKEIDTLLLACTHYPLLQPLIQKELGASVKVVDPAQSCAEQVRTFLLQNNLANPQKEAPHYQFYVSDDPEKFRLLGPTFLHHPIEHISLRS